MIKVGDKVRVIKKDKYRLYEPSNIAGKEGIVKEVLIKVYFNKKSGLYDDGFDASLYFAINEVEKID